MERKIEIEKMENPGKTAKIGRVECLIIIFAIPFFLFWHWFEPAARKNQDGIKAYQAQKYDEALKKFLSAKGIKPELSELKANTASALYQMKKYKEALEEFSKIDPAKSNMSRGNFYYNLANSYFRNNQFQEALDNYKKSLKWQPGDMDAKKNFELTLKKLEEEKKKQEQNKQDQKKDKKEDDKKKDDKKKEQDKKDQDDKKKEDENKKDQQQQNQPQQQDQKKDQKYQNLMQFLNQNEKKQLKEKKRAIGIVKKEKDW